MKFLFSLTLFLVLANAHLSMFKPAVDCAAEKTEEQLTMEAAKLERLKADIPVACELLAEKETEAEDAVTPQSVTEGDVETEDDVETEKRGGKRKGPKGGKGRKGARGLMKQLTTEMCAEATASDEGLASVVEQVRANTDPCSNDVTFETVVSKVKDMCARKSESSESESSESEETTEDDEENTEEEVLVEQLMVELGMKRGKGKGRGKDRKEKQTPAVCDMSEDELKTRYDAFFSADEEPINKHEAELGFRKMKVMNVFKNKFSEDNCESEGVVVEGEIETDAGEESDGEEEADPSRLVRRFLKRGGHGKRPSHGGRKPEMGGRKPNMGERKPDMEGRKPNMGDRKPDMEARKPGKGRGGEEKRENPAKDVLEAFKCVPVTTDSINQLFEDVQKAVEKAREEPGTVVEEEEKPVDGLNAEVVEEEEKPKRRQSGRGRRGGMSRGGRGGNSRGGDSRDSGRVEKSRGDSRDARPVEKSRGDSRDAGRGSNGKSRGGDSRDAGREGKSRGNSRDAGRGGKSRGGRGEKRDGDSKRGGRRGGRKL